MKKNIFLICIVIIAVFLRFNNLSLIPPSGSLDEVSIGYNAYSILKTGADEYGTKFPILLRAYDDWRPSLYVYLVIPFVKFMGLNVLSVRLPSAILSVLTIVAAYFLVRELFNRKTLALLSSFLLAISPWHIYISRLGHEVNVGLSFVIFAILFFLKAVNSERKSLFLVLSSIFFSLTLYTYQSEKVFVPLIILVLGFVYRDSLLKIKKELLISLILGIILIIPIITSTLTPEGLVRFKGTSAFSENFLYRESADKVLKYKNEKNVLGQIIYNRRLVPLKIFSINYFSHLSPKFLFFNSGNESFKAPNLGLLYVWEFLFLIIGFIYLLKSFDKKIKLILIFWVLISFVAPSLTTGSPHAMRAFNVLPVPQIFTALGIFAVFNFIKVNKINGYLFKFFYLCVMIIIIYFLINFYRGYFFAFPKNQSASFQHSLYKSMRYVIKNEKFYKKIVFSNKDNLYQSYMFYLFYSEYDPSIYRKLGGTKSGGFAETHEFGKYEFRPIAWSKDKFLKRTLFIGNAQDFPNSINVLASFANLDERGVIKVVKN